MDKQYRTYTDEFKRRALELWQSSSKSAAQVERAICLGQGPGPSGDSDSLLVSA